MKRGRAYVDYSSSNSGTAYGFGCTGAPKWMTEMREVTPQSVAVNHPIKVPDLIRLDKRLEAAQGIYGNGGGLSQNNIITFNVPNSAPIDFRGGFIFMDVVLGGTAGTYIRMSQGVWSIINKIRIVCGDFEDQIQFYNRFYSFIFQTGTDNDVKSTIGYDLLGLGLQSDRNGWGANANGTSYVMPFYYGLFRQGIMPMNSLSNPENASLMRVELYIDTPTLVLETDYTAPWINVINMRWHYTTVSSCDGSFESDLARIVSSGNFKIGYESYDIMSNPIIGSQADLNIQKKHCAINSFIHWMVDASAYSNTAVNDKFITYLRTLSNGVSVNNYQMNVNDSWLPVEAVDCTGIAFRAYVMFLNFLGIWKLDGRAKFAAPVTLTGFNTDEFFMTLDLRSIPRVWENPQEMFNNVNTSYSTQNTLLRLNLTNPPPANVECWTAISYNILACAESNGKLYKSS